MKRFISKKTVAIGVTAGLLLGVSGAAFAYFSSTGTGTGSATVGSSAALAITQAAPVSGLVPNGPAQTINYTVTNGTASAEYVNQVSTTVSSVTSGSGSGEACANGMFTIINGAPVAANLQPGQSAPGTATIQLVDDGNNQDNCQGATVSLAFSSN